MSIETNEFESQNDANARLIASAPGLLKVCKEAMEIVQSFNGDHDEWNGGRYDFSGVVSRCQNAIAKAEGSI
jgi:hypothetical protein